MFTLLYIDLLRSGDQYKKADKTSLVSAKILNKILKS